MTLGMTTGVAKVTISLPADLLEGVDAVATREGIARSALITRMLSASVTRAGIDAPAGLPDLRAALIEADEAGAPRAARIIQAAIDRQLAT
jgi:hypothetical protein